MRTFLIAASVLFLGACETTRVERSSEITTDISLSQTLTLPVPLAVAFHVDKFTPEDKFNFVFLLEEAARLVTEDVFIQSEKLKETSRFDYLIKLKAASDWNRGWGRWESDLQFEVIDASGQSLFSHTGESRAYGSRAYEINALHNGLAEDIKEFLIDFLNQNQSLILAASGAQSPAGGMDPELFKVLFPNLDPEVSGTGFFITPAGKSLTAAHIVDECIAIEIQHKGQTFPATISGHSTLLDLAILDIEYENSHRAMLHESTVPVLGKQVFVTGYPLANLLSEYPSVTVGNVSSQGGLKGSEGYFQFTAPVQPGNSGGPIIDFRGNVVGMVSATLNQAMLLEEAQTIPQNLNFGIDVPLITKFLNHFGVAYESGKVDENFEYASAAAVEYTNQVFCYQ